MSKRDERAHLLEAGFEQVYVENDWYDGPRSGLASMPKTKAPTPCTSAVTAPT
ncbi:hypothetical protein OH805_26065 [Streptomyces sp. NBC_00879]|uniref:hypothetical protein n=1 Tax=Streptomyces sp. NBC_00879 TaxID=2975855 RepID=UPI0038651A92|nr:hypothetical protein OH805_26065 [Streptomyces sp. NBC_00879]